MQEDRKTISIGRDIKNDIVIDNSSISRNHALITLEGNEYRLQDNNSLNGVFVNGRKVEFEVISPRDRITIGTEHALDWSRIEKAFRVKGKSADEFRLSGPSISIGRDPDNDIVIDDPIVSRKHARIYQNEITGGGTRYYIEDLDSRNGLFVNGEKVTSCQISPQDRITLGNHCQLNWQEVHSSFRRKFSPPAPPPLPPLSQPMPDLMPAQKKSGNAGLWVAGAVGGLILIIGVVLLISFARRSSPSQGSLLAEQRQPINVSSKYYLKPGEPQDIAQRRAKIEAQREILEKAKDFFPNNNPFATSYSIFSPEVTNQTYLEDEQAFITDISAEMSMPEFEAKMNYINTHQDLYDRLEALQSEYDASYALVGEAESNMIQSYQTYQESIDPQSPTSFDYNRRESSTSTEQYYIDCVSTYLEQVEMTEKTISDLSEPAATLNQIPISTFVDSQDPRDIYVSAVNGNWTTKGELLDLFEDASKDDSSKDMMSDVLDGIIEKNEILNQLYHDLLGCFVQEGGRIVISKDDLSVSYLNNNLASVTFTDEACSRLSLSIEFKDSTPQEIRNYLNKNNNGLQDSYESSLNNLNQSMIKYLKEPKYIVREGGGWRLSIWDETLRE